MEQVIDVKTLKRLLADRGVLPEWAVGDDRISIESHEIHKDDLEDIVRFIWEMGKLKEVPIITLAAQVVDDAVAIPKDVDFYAAADSPSRIRGRPIKDEEVDRGARVTSKATRAVYEQWGNIPELKEFIPEDMNASNK